MGGGKPTWEGKKRQQTRTPKISIKAKERKKWELWKNQCGRSDS